MRLLLITLTLYISCCSASLSDGMPGGKNIATDIPPPQLQEDPTKLVLQESESPEKVEEPKAAEKQQPKPKEPLKKHSQDFKSAFLGMMIALGKIIGIILSLAGLVYLYKKIRRGATPATVPIDQNMEPQTIDEAFASYARHKLRK